MKILSGCQGACGGNGDSRGSGSGLIVKNVVYKAEEIRL